MTSVNDNDPFKGRPWCYCRRTEGEQFDEIFAWADDVEMDVLCQGIMQGTRENPDDLEWYSVWSFGSDEERTMFLLRFT